MYTLLSYPRFKALLSTGAPAVGYLLYTYTAGTSTANTTYFARTLLPADANANPIVLDAAGEAVVYLSEATKLVLKTAAGVQVWSMDYVGELQTGVHLSGAADAGTTNNNYTMTAVPAPLAYSDNLMVLMTPDADN